MDVYLHVKEVLHPSDEIIARKFTFFENREFSLPSDEINFFF